MAYIGLQPCDDSVVRRRVWNSDGVFVSDHRWQPDLGIGIAEWERKRAGHDANYDVRQPVQLDYLSEDIWIAAVGGSPYGIAENEIVGLASQNGAVALAFKAAAHGGVHA